MAYLHQTRVAEYHAEMDHSHHGGQSMFIFHGQWHLSNPDPVPPANPDPNWGTNFDFGSHFLQMHHEMVKATVEEPKEHMMHDSIALWYQKKQYDLPPVWNPTLNIPDNLGYEPDLSVFPIEIQEAIRGWAQEDGVSPENFLKRLTNNANYDLPKYFTREGVAEGEKGERYTGARKLADFKNANQLGCCIVFPHNRWHGTIGGAMDTFWTAIADPIFYFGVHWKVDQVFDEFKAIQSERSRFSSDLARLKSLKSLKSEHLELDKAFSEEDFSQRVEDIHLSQKLHRSLPTISTH